MSDKKSVNFLPEHLRSDKNRKFLSSTIDQLIATPQLERIDGYVGSKLTPNYNPTTDIYLKEDLPLRKNYQLEPALVFKDSINNINDVIGFDDIINELTIQGAKTENLDKILRSSYYSYDPLIDWDKLINYSDYYWMPNGPDAVLIDNTSFDVLVNLINQPSFTLPSGHEVSNGLKVVFTQSTASTTATIVEGREYIVEGVGSAIQLVNFDNLQVNENYATVYNETFDSDGFDDYPYDSDVKLPVDPEYITINKASRDLNPWTRYNRWFHKDVLKISAEINNQILELSVQAKARRPIIEFKANLQLYNFGRIGKQNVDVIDDTTENALATVQGAAGYYVDGILLEQGQRVIFTADSNEDIKNKIYQIDFTLGETPTINLVLVSTPDNMDSVSVNYGTAYGGKSFYYSEAELTWKLSQQHDRLNQAPLFDLYDTNGISYTEAGSINDFQGTKIFGYAIGTGVNDEVLGFPLKYQNSIGIGSYLFHNYFMTDTVNITEGGKSRVIKTGIGYLKINNIDDTESLINVWKIAEDTQIPIVELQTVEESTSTLFITSLDKPYITSTEIISYVNNSRVTSTTAFGNSIEVNFAEPLAVNDVVKFEIFTDQIPNGNGYYETPLSLTNNPLNSDIADFTLSELSDHVGTMVGKISSFEGQFPGTGNLRDIADISKYGKRLVINKNPIAFTEIFLGKSEHNLVTALRHGADQYIQYKMNFIRLLEKVDDQLLPIDAVDEVLKLINKNKDNRSPYFRSDMIPYGSDRTVKEYTVGPLINRTYSLGIEYNPSALSFQAVTVYVNDDQLIIGRDYTIDSIDESITISSALTSTDIVKIYTYSNTQGSYVPYTPSKLGLYPKFEPEIYFDESYQDSPIKLIRCHDGSVIKAFDDYRDVLILEFEKRIFNNIKVEYNSKIFDVLAVIPGAFRNDKFSRQDAIDILTKDFIRWAGSYNVDFETNSTFIDGSPLTYNYNQALDTIFGESIPGNWKGIFEYFYDTVRPNTHPWEMLGFTSEPSWWQSTYGSAPYTSNNTVLWNDLENGFVRGTGEYRNDFKRSGLISIIPVDSAGNLKSPDTFLVSDSSYQSKKGPWKFGDYGPAEFAWRRSSSYPFALSILAALFNPSTYTSVMFDVSRLSFNNSDQLLYSNELYIAPSKLILDNDNNQAAGFGNLIIEKGNQVDLNYIQILTRDLTYCDFNLFYKLGGFSSKEKLQVIIDSIDPVSTGKGALLPPEDYSLILNVSNPIKAARISGIIVQLVNGKFVVRGYDKTNPYFQIYKPIKTNNSQSITVGGVSAPFVDYIEVVPYGNNGLTAADLTSAQTNTTKYYKQGQIVRYNDQFYRVKTGHTASADFDPNLFQRLSGLPIVGGVSAELPTGYENKITIIPYGTEFDNHQAVFDFVLGYGRFLEQDGFIFEEYNTDLLEVLDWTYTGKEFLYWTTQNWSEGNLITLSPFANSLQFKFSNSVVDNITGKNYEYSLLGADGRAFPREKFTLSREDGVCTISTVDTQDGIFFAVLHLVQKEHGMVFNNTTIFNDTIYDIESGYRQRRVKLSGFKTANWNGDYSSPGFIFDNVQIAEWQEYTYYQVGSVVRYNGSYYEAVINVDPVESFDFNKWAKLYEKPVPDLLPNFDYKINQFEDFYSLDIDNFDSVQQQLSQRLVGYTQRPYLSNIFTNPITQYKFYQGFIREKGTRNAIDKISKAGTFTRQGIIDYKEEWAIRAGNFGGFETYKEYEFALEESTERENPYIVKFVNTDPTDKNPLINYTSSTGLLIKPNDFDASQIFSVYSDSTFIDNNIKLLSAGYVNPDHVVATAYNKDSLLDIANNSAVKDRDTIWLGFLENGDWDVYRYTRQKAKISGVFVSAPAEEITFVTDFHHGLLVGDIVSVVAFNNQVNGVYRVTGVPELNQFTVASELSTIVNEELLAFGALFKFETARFSDFEQISNVKNLFRLGQGDKIWIDQAPEKWAVYEKVDNYKVALTVNSPAIPSAQQLGHTIYANEDSPIVLISSPSWSLPIYDSEGRIAVFERFEDEVSKQFEYILNSDGKIYCENNTATDFGYSLGYDINKELFLAGAPAASKVRSSTSTTATIVVSTGTGTFKSFDNQGLIKISSRKQLIDFEETKLVLLAPGTYSDTTEKAANLRYGHSLYTNQVSAQNSTTFLVGAPGDGVVNTSTGHVFCYYINTTTTGSVLVTQHSQGIVLNSNVILDSKSQFGEKISGSTNGNFIAVSAPGHVEGTTATGVVQIYNANLSWKQTLYSPFGTTDVFGHDIEVSPSGKFLIISSKETREAGQVYGKIAIYTATNLTSTGTYVLRQIIENPETTNDLKFGQSISISKDELSLVVSSIGVNRSKQSQFDINTRDGETTFDSDTTRFFSPISDAGSVYLYNNFGDYFVIADELKNNNIVDGSRYGYSLATTNRSIFVGAPWYAEGTGEDKSTFFQYTKIDQNKTSWNLLAYQEDLVDVNTINRVALIDSKNETIIEYLDAIDPIKGKVAGIAEQEIKYKTAADPAVYTIGTVGTVNDDQTNWIDEHVGELWWDVSTAKYMWYEQGSEIYKKNNWGRLFPGASIDVYEWVKSDLLPSEWAAQADTNEGLVRGISGQPKYPDNSILSVKQVWNSLTNSFNNVYYFWVKNKVTVPDVKNRRISSYQVASLIADPVANGIKHVMVLAKDSVAFANINTSLVGSYIHANIAVDSTNNSVPRHTEWILIREGDPNSIPTPLLNKKLFDSLLGHDEQGKLVPDPDLSFRSKYGIGIRPQQTLFKDRLQALRNLIDYTNSVLIDEKITGNFSFENLLSFEQIPDITDQEYDLLIDDISELELIDTTKFERAQLVCDLYNGKIVSVEITNPGFGYSVAPTVKIASNTGNGAVIKTEIDAVGRVVGATIEDNGQNYVDITLEVRSHSVVVSADSNYGGRWTKHDFEYRNRYWIRTRTQSYNTPLFWKYVDWIKDTYDGYKDYRYVVDNTYELSRITEIDPGDYVKIKNYGDGRYIILERVADDQVGDYSTSYDIIYSERGTIQILDTIWDYTQSDYSYDVGTLEETLYDQLPDLELNFILTALKDDIFIKNLKVYWNLFFFKALKYALTEQKLLDWAFKTSFISVTNTIGELDQRSVYKLDNEKYFEEYINEVKPYRTKVRNYVSEYTYLENTGIHTTDFDLPSYYNPLTGNFETVSLGNSLLNEYPRKDWYDNYKYEVTDVLIANGGSGYTQRPIVVFTTATGDTGSGAAAEAYLRNGEIYNIVVTNPGSGYVTPPIISLINGGSNVVSATMSVVIGNNPVRKNNIKLKFDRIGLNNEIGESVITETFTCPGEVSSFELKWLADPDKSTIVPLLDKKLVLGADYTIEYYRVRDNGSTKKYCRFKFLNYLPGLGQTLQVTYKKNIELYNAVDRIDNFYNPTEEMPGKELPLLMSGAEYSSSVIQGLTFDYSPPWGQGIYDVNSAWSDLTDYYASSYLIKTAPYGTSTLFLSTLTGISVGQKITLTNTATNYIKKNMSVASVNTATKSINLTDYRFRIKRIWADTLTTTGTVVFYTTEYFGGDIKVGDIADISGVNNATLTGFNGRYVVTGVGNDRFTAVGTGSHATSVLSTTSARTLSTTASVYIPSVLQEINTWTVYEIYRNIDTVSNTSTVFYDTGIPYNAASTASVYLNGDTNSLPNYPVLAEYYLTSATATGNLGVTIFLQGTTNILDVVVHGYPKIEFWKDNFNVNGVDTELSAGSWDSAGNFVGALGVSPVDLVRDGAGFISVEHGHAPEEHVKGNVLDSVGISVYTQDNFSSPLVVSGTVPVYQGVTSVSKLSQKINEAVGITVEYKGAIFDRLTETPDPETVGPYYSPEAAVPIGVTGSPIASAAGDDTFTGPYSLGFGWNMFGTVYNEVYVGTNGYLTFGGGDNEYTPLNINALENPSIMVMYCDLWQAIGIFDQPLENGQAPGLWFDSGTVGNFNYWRLRFQGSHYQYRNNSPELPTYQYEVGLYSDGTNQYVEMIFENTWREVATLTNEPGFITGIASPNGAENVEVSWTSIQNNTSHVFYSTSDGGDWRYAGQGRFDPNKDPFNFTATNQFFVYEDKLYIAPQLSDGRAGYTMITMGGSYYLDSNIASVVGESSVAIPSLSSIEDVKSAYVTVNGVQIDSINTTTDYGYMLEPYGDNNNRASVKIYNMSTGSVNAQAWFFGINYPEFNGMWTEIFAIDTATSLLTITNMVSTLEPISSQILVEHEPSFGQGRYRLYPPDVTYYQIGGNQLTYDIGPEMQPPGTYDINNVKVYANGVQLRSGFDYTVDGNNGQIVLAYGLLANGDTIAIESLLDYDYVVMGNQVIFSNPSQLASGSVKLTTFKDNSGIMLRSERFNGNASGRYVLSLPALSASYIWVYINGSQITAGSQYELLPDLKTVQLSELIVADPGDEILITVINSPKNTNIVLGYRMFKDIFDRNNYTRISEFYSTRLTKELNVDDIEIEVEDSSRLIPPNPAQNVPGVIYIDSERVEFFEKRDNKLSNLRRSMYGTGPATFSEIGTKVVDQSLQQQIPYADKMFKQYHVTSSTTGTYVLTTVTNTYNTYTFVISTSSFEFNTGSIYASWGDGVQLKNSAAYKDQITVRYGGRPLRKNSIEVHDRTVSYYTTVTSLVTLPPEFEVEYNSTTGNYELKLNIADFVPGVRVDIGHTTGTVWQGTMTSLLVADSIQAEFIRFKTAELPDEYYYGGTPALTDNANFELTDDDDNPLEGY